MMQRVLSFERTPPLEDPLRYFLTAPAFALAAALVLLWHGADALASRWSPVTLALTHLLTLGFLTLVMIGALLQMLPVVAGACLPRPRLSAIGVYLLLAAGSALLCAAFLLSMRLLFLLAMPLLGLGVAGLLLAAWLAMRGQAATSATVSGIRLALWALAATAALGLTLAGAFVFALPLPLIALTDLHALWGLGGWVGLLVVGVAYQVVPMFQVTPVYPAAMTRWLAWALFGAAVTASAGLPGFGAAVSAAGYLLFALATLTLLWKRKRPKPDASALFWYLGMGSLATAAAGWLASQAMPGLRTLPAFPLALGVLLLAGFGYSVVNGMLYKIVPFLVWYHLQARLSGAPVRPPNVRQVIGEDAARAQFGLHVLALLLLLLATFWPQQLARAAGAAFFLSAAALWCNLLRAARMYRVRSRGVARATA